MKLYASLGNPFLIFLYSLAILLFGCAVGLHWKATPGGALCLAGLGALLMVIHDMAMGVLWFWLQQRCSPKLSDADHDDLIAVRFRQRDYFFVVKRRALQR